MEEWMEKVKKGMHLLCGVLELVAAALVLIGILLSVLSLIKDFDIFHNLLGDISLFRHYLEEIFMIVIGIEFLEMLCRPNSDNVLEVLIFLVARHMIVGETTPFEDFISVISIAILCVLRRVLHLIRKKEETGESFFLKTGDRIIEKVKTLNKEKDK